MDYDTMLRKLEEIEQWAWSNAEVAKLQGNEDDKQAWDELADVVSDAQGFARSNTAVFANAAE